MGDPDAIIEPLHRVVMDTLSPAGMAPFAVLNPIEPVSLVPSRELVADPLLVAARYWPWVGTPPALLLLVLIVWRLGRVRSRRQRAGVRYCRTCNYDLSATGAGVELCAECGAKIDQRGVVLGRSALRRSWWLGVPIALLVAMLCVMAALACGWTPPDYAWPSQRLQRAADKLGIAVPKELRRECTAIYQIDLAAGTLTKRALFPGRLIGCLRYTPDGRMVIGARGDGTYCRFDAEGGNFVRAPFAADSPRATYGMFEPIVGATPDGSSVYLMRHSSFDREPRVWHWSLKDDSVTVLRNLSVSPVPGDGVSPGGLPRIYERVRGDADRFLSFPPVDRQARDPYIIGMHSGAAEPDWTFNVGAIIDPDVAHAVTFDGTMMYLTASDGMAIVSVDLTGPSTPETLLPPARIRARELAVDYTGRYLVAGGDGREGAIFAVRDVQKRAWVATLGVSGMKFASRPMLSRDGRYVTAALYSPTRKSFDEFAVWDVSEITKAIGNESRP